MRRKIFNDIMAHRTPERPLLDLGGCPLSGIDDGMMRELLDFMGFTGYQPSRGGVVDERILTALDIDTRGVGYILAPVSSNAKRISPTESVDEWGIRRKFTGLYWDIIEYPLKDATLSDLKNYNFPKADMVVQSQIDQIAEDAKWLYEETDYVICGSHPVFGVFELACWLCGFEDIMIRMAIEPEFVYALFDIIYEYQEGVIKRYYDKAGRWFHYTSSGDDFATQQSTFMSPAMFDGFIAPYMKKRISLTREFTGAKYLHHSCGNVFELIPSLIDVGVDILNPIQPTNDAMSPRNLKAAYGGRIVFHGGFDTQEILPNAGEDTIKKEAKALVDVMNKDGGYIFAAAHNIQRDVPPENIIAMFKGASKL